jgi:hypothetical protein
MRGTGNGSEGGLNEARGLIFSGVAVIALMSATACNSQQRAPRLWRTKWGHPKKCCIELYGQGKRNIFFRFDAYQTEDFHLNRIGPSIDRLNTRNENSMSLNTEQTIPEQAPTGTTPPYTLFDSRAVALATFFGTPAAGSSLMALNYRRLGQSGKAVIALVLGIAVTGLVILFTWNLPHSVTFPVALALLFGMQRIALWLQGPAVKEHVQLNGRLGSKWRAFGMGATWFAAIVLAIFIPVYANNNNPRVVIGSKDAVYYTGSATKAEAQALGDALKESGYFSDSGASGNGADAYLAKGKDGTVISFIVKDGSWDQPGVMPIFEEIGREVASSVGGFPLQVRLMNTTHDVKKESTVGKAAFAGDDDVYYLGAATEAQAQALGQILKSIGVFKAKGASVFLSKHSDGTALSFVVGKAAWDDPAAVGYFENTVRQSAPAVGGLPVRLRLVDTLLQVKKDEMVK